MSSVAMCGSELAAPRPKGRLLHVMQTWSLLHRRAAGRRPRSKTMAIAISLQQYLGSQGIAYDCVEHKRTGCSARTAEAAHVPSDCLAKGVVLKRRDGYLMAVVPASEQVRLERVGAWLGQPIGLATEDEITRLFHDCEPGAVPPVAQPYGLEALVDESLEGKRDIYFEAGDHRTLVHMSGEQFHRLIAALPHGRFCGPSETGDAETWYSGA
jgi:Ala-tRNA(Pro) deacylase